LNEAMLIITLLPLSTPTSSCNCHTFSDILKMPGVRGELFHNFCCDILSVYMESTFFSFELQQSCEVWSSLMSTYTLFWLSP